MAGYSNNASEFLWGGGGQSKILSAGRGRIFRETTHSRVLALQTLFLLLKC